jgi:hypothetical protein
VENIIAKTRGINEKEKKLTNAILRVIRITSFDLTEETYIP